MKSFLMANVPLSIVHFVCFIFFTGIRDVLGQPGFILTKALGASTEGAIWWALMILNSLIWGAVLSLIVFPLIRKILK